VAVEFCERFVYYYSGYLFAPFIFASAERVLARPGLALAALAAWALGNGALVFAGLADLPGFSLALGFAGAGAIVTVAALLSHVRWVSALGFLGRHSIVVYLAFFLPMAAARAVLLKLGVLDVGTMGLLVTAAAVVGPLATWQVS